MPVDESVHRVIDESEGSLSLDHIRGNGRWVQADHMLFKEVQSRLANSVRPPSFDDFLKTQWDLDPHPLPESEVDSVTREAVCAFKREIEAAGGTPTGGAIDAIKAEVREGDSVSADLKNVVVGADQTMPHPVGPIDLYALAKILEDALVRRFEGRFRELGGEIQESIAGLGLKLDVAVKRQSIDSKETDQPTPLPQPKIDSLNALTIQERRAIRHEQALKTIENLRTLKSKPAILPKSQEVSSEKIAYPKTSSGSKTEKTCKWMSRNFLYAFQEKPRRKSRLWMTAGCLCIVAIVSGIWIWLHNGSEIPLEAIRIEKQLQGYGTYIRTEEAALERLVQRKKAIDTEISFVQAELRRTKGSSEQEALKSRFAQSRVALGKVGRSEEALKTLHEIADLSKTENSGKNGIPSTK